MQFRYLLASQSVSVLGDILYIVSLVSFLYGLSGSASVAALFPLCRVIGLAIGGLLAPTFLARRRNSLKSALTMSILAQSGGLASLASYAMASGEEPFLPAIVGFVLALSFLEGVAVPARATLLPRIVAENRLVQANGLLSAVLDSCSLVAWAFGALIASWAGIGSTLLISACMQFIAFLFSLRIGLAEEDAANQIDHRLEEKRGLLYGWKLFLRVPKLRSVGWTEFWEGTFGAVFAGAFLLVYTKEALGAGEQWWGWLNGAYSAGLIGCSLLLGRFFKQNEAGIAKMLIVGVAAFSALTFWFSFSTKPIWALFIVTLMGIAYALKGLGIRTAIQTSVSPDQLPFVFSAHSTLISVMFGASLLLCGWLSDAYGIRILYVCAGSAFAVALPGALALLRSRNSPRADVEM
jgi:MFS transporter, DHA3 family, macrolide efflux protein